MMELKISQRCLYSVNESKNLVIENAQYKNKEIQNRKITKLKDQI